jgi:hypothetical protein
LTGADLPVWPLNQAALAVELLARALGWSLPEDPSPPAPPDELSLAAPVGTPGNLCDYVDVVTSSLGLESEFVSVRLRELSEFVRGAAPALILLSGPTAGLLALLRAESNRLQLLAPDGSVRTIEQAAVVRALGEPRIAQGRSRAERLLDAAEIQSATRRQAALDALLSAQFPGSIPAGFLLRLGAMRSLREHSKGVSLPGLLKGFAATHFLQYVCGVLLTYIAGSTALSGHVDTGWRSAAASGELGPRANHHRDRNPPPAALAVGRPAPSA